VQKTATMAKQMAKNPPLVGHFPVCTHAVDQVSPCGPRGMNVTVARQEPAIILKMSAEPAVAQVRVGLASRML
jgi:hypothetical protein